jgi:hypothetical protein
MKRLALLWLAWACTARADNGFVAKTQVYADSDHTTVVSPLVAVDREAWKGATLSASWVADVISSASIDVVSNATRRISEFRNEVSAGIKQQLRDTTLQGAYIYSTEHDYSSHNVSLGIAQDLFKKNTTLSLGWALSLDRVGRTGDPAFHRSLMVNSLEVGWTQVLSRATLMQLGYQFFYDSGYEASPYRFVRIERPSDGSTEFKVPETDPSTRLRHAFVAALNRHLGQDTVLSADYRIYFDSWGLVAHTVQLRYLVSFRNGLTLRLRERFYYQNGASFYRPNYTSDDIPRFVTADRELSTFWSEMLGFKLSWNLPWWKRRLSAEVKVDGFYFGYNNFPLLHDRYGANCEAGLSVNY